MLQRVHPEVAQNAAGQGTESGAAGVSCRYNYDMDSKRNGEELVQIFVDADACPVVAMALRKGAYAIHQSGKWYTNDKNVKQGLQLFLQVLFFRRAAACSDSRFSI